MNRYPHSCDSDALQEMIEYTLAQLHQVGECDGAPVCGECLDAIEASKRGE